MRLPTGSLVCTMLVWVLASVVNAAPPTWDVEAAVGGDPAAQLRLARYYRERSDRVRALHWAKRAAAAGSLGGQSLLAEINPRAFRRMTRRYAAECEVGALVRVSGLLEPLAAARDSGYRLRRRRGPPVLLTGATKGMKAGRFAVVYGRMRPAGVRVMLWETPAPRYRYRYRLIPNGAVGGTSQVYTVEVAVRNVGRQPITRLDLGVRFRQPLSPNDETATASVGPLPPGESRTVTARVTFYNHCHAGRTSVPRVSVGEQRMDW
jgi:hypothetical protein